MKKNAKKIGLKKETLRALQLQELKAGGAGQWSFSCYSICDCHSDEYTISCGC